MLAPWEYFWNPWNPLTAAVKQINASEQVAALGGVNLQTGVAYTVVAGDCAKLLSFNNAAAVAVTLNAPGTYQFPFWFMVENRGAGAVTITPGGGSTIDGAANLVVNQNKGAVICTDGSNYYTQRGGT